MKSKRATGRRRRMILLGDLIGFAGLGLAARGLWMIWPALALVVVGVFLLVFGILIAARS